MAILRSSVSDLDIVFFEDIFKVIRAALYTSDNLETAFNWYTTHKIKDLGDLTPMELVRMGKAKTVLKYIETLSEGALG